MARQSAMVLRDAGGEGGDDDRDEADVWAKFKKNRTTASKDARQRPLGRTCDGVIQTRPSRCPAATRRRVSQRRLESLRGTSYNEPRIKARPAGRGCGKTQEERLCCACDGAGWRLLQRLSAAIAKCRLQPVFDVRGESSSGKVGKPALEDGRAGSCDGEATLR